MRKISNNVPLVLCVIVIIISSSAIWILVESQEKVLAKVGDREQLVERVLTFQERQPIYMEGTALTQIGMLEENQPVTVIGEVEEFYELRLGNMPVLVPKGRATVESTKTATFVNTERLAAVRTIHKTIVYEDADLQSRIIMVLEEDYRYPVIQEDEDWYVLTIGERPGYIHKQSVVLDEGLPVLVYHQVLPRELMTTMDSTISLESFERQMGYLADHQFETLTANQLYDYLEGRLVVPGKAVLITFDDGLLSTKEYAYPLLKKYGFRALQHIISSRTDRAQGAQLFDAEGPPQFFTAEDIEVLADVFQFEAHTYELHSLNKDSSVGVALDRSKEEILLDLQQNIDQVPTAVSIAYPYGQYNENFIAAAKDAGLLIGFTTTEGYANRKKSNYEVNRYGITEKKSFEQFVAYVEGAMTWP